MWPMLVLVLGFEKEESRDFFEMVYTRYILYANGDDRQGGEDGGEFKYRKLRLK